MNYVELVEKFGRAQLGIDGNCGFSMIGENLQTGEAEFAEISNPYCLDSQLLSCKLAHKALTLKLGTPDLKYYFGASHPYGS